MEQARLVQFIQDHIPQLLTSGGGIGAALVVLKRLLRAENRRFSLRLAVDWESVKDEPARHPHNTKAATRLPSPAVKSNRR